VPPKARDPSINLEKPIDPDPLKNAGAGAGARPRHAPNESQARNAESPRADE